MEMNVSKSFVEFRKEEIEQSIPSRFGQQVRRFPNHIAIQTRTQHLTYDELDCLSNRVAHAVLARCGTKEEPIALLFEPGISMAVGILGALKAGKFILPLDPSSPVARNALILEGSKTSHVLTDTRNQSATTKLDRSHSALINVDDLDPNISDAPVDQLSTAGTPAYVLYTSGSTGYPKGVLHNHRNVLHAIYQHTNSLRIHSEDRISLLASYTRIAGMTSIWRALLNGATLCVFNLLAEGWGELLRWLIAEEITIYQSVPTLFRHWAQVLTGEHRFPKLRIIHLGGEPVTIREVALYQKHFSPESFLLHNLGSTEVSTYRQYFISPETPVTDTVVPVGYPVEDKEVILLDESGQKVGPNQIGEIAVKSRYLAVEYWREPELTREAFLPDPSGGDERLFRTGDLGRMRADGCLEHLGRKDRQVKIRGIRVEPAEIEVKLGQHPSVRQAVVVARQDAREQYQLIAYLIAASNAKPSSTVLRGYLRELLPEYMVPSAFVTLDQFPLTASGKVDQLALPAPGPTIPHSETPFVAPNSPTEKTVAQIWEEVLGVPGVGLNDRFLDLGGSSLKAIQIITRLQDVLGGVLPLEPLLNTVTVAQQAAAIEEHLSAASKEDQKDFLAELEAMSEEEAETRLASLGQGAERTERKKSQWQTEGMSRAFLEVRSAFPGADLQVEVMLKIIRAWCPAPKTAIDLGCGDGFLGRILMEHFPECQVWFLDFSAPMLYAAQQKLSRSDRATIVRADFSQTGWVTQLGQRQSFDLVLSGLAIHHQTDVRKQALYGEIYDLLSVGGVFLNLEQVASSTAQVSDVYHEYLIDNLYAFYRQFEPYRTRQNVADGYYSSPARKENILALAETQCRWLRDIGFQDVDCFFKVFEHALLGGRKTTLPQR
jgi:amino acid adenylation domain-containing protein